jgi:putative PIN family toxin of toxin-antitoxin system
MVKVVLDTNVLISNFNFPKSKPAQILDLIAAGEVSNFISEPILAEAERILTDKFFWALPEVEAVAFWLKTFCHLVRPKTHLAVILDGPDNRILECAVTGQADFIITGDKHLLVLNAYLNIDIVKPADFLVIFQSRT